MFNSELGLHVKNMSREAVDQLLNYDWPGNIRDLLETLGGVRMMFDVIIISAVLGTATDPATTLKRAYTLLQPTGLCLLVTHNAAGRTGHVYDFNHLFYFTEGTLHQLCDAAHLGVVRTDLRDEFGQPGSDCIYAVLRKR